jgi:hypothetical protein
MDCKTGIVKDYTCDDQTEYPVPSGGSSIFYTTWSFNLIFAAVCLLVLFLILHAIPMLRKGILSNKWLQLSVIPLIAMPAINSIGVLWTSQLLLAKNFKLVSQPNDSGKKGLTTTFFSGITNINFKAHILPGLVGIFVLMGLSLGRTSTSRPWKLNLGMACLIVILNLLFIGIWMAVPENGKTGLNKLNDVYNNPPPWFFAAQAGIVLGLAFIVSFRIA